MLRHPLRRLIRRRAEPRAGLALLATLLGCTAEPADDPLLDAARFVEDAEARRGALEESVEPAPEVEYAAIRLAHYGGAWEDAPVSALRRVRPIYADGREPEEREAGPVAELEGLVTLEDWVRAGEAAYARLPIQTDLALARHQGELEAYGLAVGADGIVRGIVEVETPRGWAPSLTCAACHDAPREGGFLAGAGNARIRYDELLGALRWGPGLMDVSTDPVENPVRPSDLRALVFQERMHHAGNLANGRLARMVRIETLIASRRGYAERPDRRLVAAIALYLEGLGDALPLPDPAHPGREPFARRCGSCHAGEAMAGATVPADAVGTDPAASTGERGFGAYRIPSLRGVADREGLLHDGSASTLFALLGLSPSAHAGHAYGLEAPEQERRAIAGYLLGAE